MNQFVRDYYDRNTQREWERLETPLSKIEFVTALRLIDQYFPASGRACDIGGGPGRYTIELLKRGYAVTLIDLSEVALVHARQQIENVGLHADQIIHGDARNLSMFENESFDAALLMGPMYHVVEADERARILRALHRILKPGGAALITYLNSWGLIKTGLSDFPERYRDIAFLRSMLNEHVFRGQELADFTECYWSTPEVAQGEIEAAGLAIISYASAQGFTAGMEAQLQRLAAEEPKIYTNVVQVAAEVSALKQYRDAGTHLHFIVRKP